MIRKHAAAIRDAFAQFEMRMVERDCLIIYEGDVERVNRGIALLEEGVEEENTSTKPVSSGLGGTHPPR